MTAKALLERIIKIRKAIDYRRTKIDALTEQAENTSARLTGMPHNPRSDSSPMASAICRKVDLEMEITKLAEERKALIAKIDLLENDDLSRLLILRYVQETPWDDIAAEMGFCERHICTKQRSRNSIIVLKMSCDVSRCQLKSVRKCGIIIIGEEHRELTRDIPRGLFLYTPIQAEGADQCHIGKSAL